jgi:hypothetical protein
VLLLRGAADGCQTKRIREEVAQSYWRTFIAQWVSVFSADPSEAPDEYRALFTELLALYHTLSLSLGSMLEQQTWTALQQSILQGTLLLFARHKTLRARDPAAEAVAEDVVHHLFVVWLRSPHNSDEQWQSFHEAFVTLLEHAHAVRGWKEKIVRLTQLLVEHYYKPTATAESDEPSAEVTPVKYVSLGGDCD